jgi:microcystin-dependent protein
VTEPFLSEIRIMSFDYAPKGWATCDGQVLPINQNQALFSLLGTTYGGDGRVTFALPDLRARVPVHVGSGHTLGERAGETAHTLSINELPTHTHALNASTQGANSPSPTAPQGNVFGVTGGNQVYGPPNNLAALDPGTVTSVGGSQAHENRMPYTVLNFCIALQGIFPSQN